MTADLCRPNPLELGKLSSPFSGIHHDSTTFFDYCLRRSFHNSVGCSFFRPCGRRHVSDQRNPHARLEGKGVGNRSRPDFFAARNVFDRWNLQPGRPWQELMADGIGRSRAGAVLVGRDGIGPWENREMQALLNRAVNLDIPVIPVLNDNDLPDT